jgi:hypothetical protein
MDWKLIIAILCVIFAFQAGSVNPPFIPVVPTPVVDVIQPEARLIELVAPIKALNLEAADKHNLSNLFLAFADIVLQDEDVIKNNAQLREAVMVAGKFMFKGELGKKYPGFSTTLSDVLKKELGDNPDSFNKEKSVNLFKALAWACS